MLVLFIFGCKYDLKFFLKELKLFVDQVLQMKTLPMHAGQAIAPKLQILQSSKLFIGIK
jgi:hypothetical protein